MADIPPLASLGRRIMICGPSNGGKSTLAVAIGRRLDVPVVHLDLLYHLPNTDWVARPKEEFAALHDEAIAGDSWVIEGNYASSYPQRLARATGIVLLGDNRFGAFARYVRRTLFERDRAGALEGNKDSLKWALARYILVEQPPKRERDRRVFLASGLPLVETRSLAQTDDLYAAWGLSRG